MALGRRPGTRLGLGFFLATLGACAAMVPKENCSRMVRKPPAGSRNAAWSEHGGNPLVSMGQVVPHMVWNDPSVMKEDDGYRMWLSGGDPRGGDRIKVELYGAQSKDGLAWQISSRPLLSPSEDPRAWDSLRVETPSVVKVGGTYHLYYSGADFEKAKTAAFSIGHATSTDGVRFTKDPANPILVPDARGKHEWGNWAAIEPGVVYDPRTRTFYLYYVSLKYSKADPTIGHLGILLATSRDGSRFTHHTDANGERALILTRDIPGATPGAWFGYSTPSVTIAPDGRFHMFCSFLVAPGGPATARQVALAHAVSPNPYDFRVVEENVFETGKGDWKDHQVWGASVLAEDGRLKLWFAGENKRPFFDIGLGFATRPLQ